MLVLLNLTAATPAHAGEGAGDRITGSLTVEHIGNHADGEPGTASVEFEAFEATAKHAARGSLQLDIANSAGEVGRRITVQVTDVWVDGTEGAFIGIVTADIRSSENGDDHGDEATEPGHDTGHDSGHGGAGDHATGKDRTGQLMAVKVTDGGSPGQFDTIDWKWFLAGTITLENVVAADHLCDNGLKVILGGNLTVHLTPSKPTKTSVGLAS